MDSAAWERAGLYDPAAPDAEDRRALLAYLVEAGASVDDMVEADRDRNLTSLAFDLRLTRGELSAADLAARSGTSVEHVVDVLRLLGVAVADPDARQFAGREVRLLEMVATAEQSLPEGMTDEILRAIGSALTVVSEAAVAAFVGSVEGTLEHGSQRARAEITTLTGEWGLELGEMMGPLFRHHLWMAVARQRAAMRTTVDRRESTVTVGFVDLVGFTAATESMAAGELLEFMRHFHSRTFDIVTRAHGRVVKHIGDEIMFTAGDAAVGCDIALALVDAFDDAGSLPRGGLAHGMVVARHGDYYGPIVNLAARLADVAVPGEVLAAADVALAVAPAGSGFAFEPAGRRQLKGFTAPVSVVSVRRST